MRSAHGWRRRPPGQFTVNEQLTPESVNPRLTPMTTSRRRRTRPTETPDFAAVVARMIAAHGRRVADADPIDLQALASLRDAVDAALDHAVTAQRERYSLSEIATGLGVSRQYVSKRWPVARVCDGHESLAGEHMGVDVYCDGSCKA